MHLSDDFFFKSKYFIVQRLAKVCYLPKRILILLIINITFPAALGPCRYCGRAYFAHHS